MKKLLPENPKSIWGGLEWNNTEIHELKKQIESHPKKEINKIFKRLVMIEVNLPKVEEFTLYDLAIEARFRTQKQNATHWENVMTMLRSIGAKPACLLINQMTPEEKLKNNLDSEKILEEYHRKQKQIYLRKLKEQKSL